MATLENWEKEDVIIVDNLAQSFAKDIENGIPILPYFKGQNDKELEYLGKLLSQVGPNTNCMHFVSEKFDLKSLQAQL